MIVAHIKDGPHDRRGDTLRDDERIWLILLNDPSRGRFRLIGRADRIAPLRIGNRRLIDYRPTREDVGALNFALADAPTQICNIEGIEAS